MTSLPAVTEDDGAVYDRRPVMFGDRPLLFVLLVVLSPVIVGALFLLAWYLATRSNRLTIEGGRVRHRQGLLSKRVKEVAIGKVRAVEVDQTFLQRMTDVGRVQLFTTGDEPEIVLGGLPRPYDVKLAVSGSDE
jgi:uncharacterized membrane protein YdbT with pleckstrin-like domain